MIILQKDYFRSSFSPFRAVFVFKGLLGIQYLRGRFLNFGRKNLSLDKRIVKSTTFGSFKALFLSIWTKRLPYDKFDIGYAPSMLSSTILPISKTTMFVQLSEFEGFIKL